MSGCPESVDRAGSDRQAELRLWCGVDPRQPHQQLRQAGQHKVSRMLLQLATILLGKEIMDFK